MAFDKTLGSSLLAVLCVLSLAAAAKKPEPSKVITGTNFTRSAGSDGGEVNNFPVNGLPPLTYSPKKYTFYSEGVSFFQAWNLCRDMGKRLASIENYQDHEAYKEQVAPYTGYFISHWIAATNVGADTNEYRKFYWITNDRPVGYIGGFSNWIDGFAPNQPNLCVASYLGSALWIYGSCATSTSAYACEESQDV